MCVVTTCCCGCDLKTGCWALAGSQIILGILNIFAMIFDAEEYAPFLGFEDDEMNCYYAYHSILFTSSILGGILIAIGVRQKLLWSIIVGIVMGYELAIVMVLPLAWHIYLTVVVCSYLQKEFT